MGQKNSSMITTIPRRSQTGRARKQAERNEFRPHLVEPSVPADTDGSPASQPILRVLETVAEFEELRKEWSAWANHLEADVDYFSVRLKHQPGIVRPHVMVVYRDGRADSMLVGSMYKGPLLFKVGSVVLFRPKACILRFVGGGFVGRQSVQNAQFLVSELVKLLGRGGVDAVNFSQLKVDSPLYRIAKREPGFLSRDIFTPSQTHRYLALPESFDEYTDSLARQTTSQLRRCKRLLTKNYPNKVRFQRFRTINEAEDFARVADTISSKTYQRALGVGFSNSLEVQSLLHAAAQKDAFRGSILWVGDKPVAFVSGIIAGNTLYATFTGYDRTYEKYGPGLQTMMHFVEGLFEPRGSVVLLDAGCGDASYKRRLFDSSWQETPVWVFAPSAKGQKLHAMRAVSASLHYAAMSLFEKSDHLRRLKKMWHRRLADVHQRESVK